MNLVYLISSLRHRARIIAAKKQASLSATALSEILGVAPTTPPPSLAPTRQGTLTTTTDRADPEATILGSELLTTSKKSVADYFKDKLLAKASGKATPPITDVSSAGSERLSPAAAEESENNTPKRPGLGTFRVRFALPEPDDQLEKEPPVRSKFSSMVSPKFSTAAASVVIASQTDYPESDGVPETPIQLDIAHKKSKKKAKKREFDSIDHPGGQEDSEDTDRKEKKRKRKNKHSGGVDDVECCPASISLGRDESEGGYDTGSRKRKSKEDRKREKAKGKAHKQEQMNEF